jgi:NAD(P)H-nitrite reductase large subunit
VLATGSKPNKYGWPGQDLQGVTGLYHKQDLEALERWAPTTKRAVIVGGGLMVSRAAVRSQYPYFL